MSDTSQGDGWWLASDGKWYPPESAPPPPPPPPPAQDSTPEPTVPSQGPEPREKLDDGSQHFVPPQEVGGTPGVPPFAAPPPAPAPKKPLTRRPWFWGGLAALIVIIVIVVAVATSGSKHPASSAASSGNTNSSNNTGSSGNSGSVTTTTVPPATTTTLSPAQYEATCTAQPSYGDLTSPNAQSGQCVTSQAQVFQYDTNTGQNKMLVDVTNEGYGLWNNVVELNLLGTPIYTQGFVKGDVIQFWGTTNGSDTYSTSIGGSNTVPVVDVKYASLVSSGNTGNTG